MHGIDGVLHADNPPPRYARANTPNKEPRVRIALEEEEEVSAGPIQPPPSPPAPIN